MNTNYDSKISDFKKIFLRNKSNSKSKNETLKSENLEGSGADEALSAMGSALVQMQNPKHCKKPLYQNYKKTQEEFEEALSSNKRIYESCKKDIRKLISIKSKKEAISQMTYFVKVLNNEKFAVNSPYNDIIDIFDEFDWGNDKALQTQFNFLDKLLKNDRYKNLRSKDIANIFKKLISDDYDIGKNQIETLDNLLQNPRYKKLSASDAVKIFCKLKFNDDGTVNSGHYSLFNNFFQDNEYKKLGGQNIADIFKSIQYNKERTKHKDQIDFLKKILNNDKLNGDNATDIFTCINWQKGSDFIESQQKVLDEILSHKKLSSNDAVKIFEKIIYDEYGNTDKKQNLFLQELLANSQLNGESVANIIDSINWNAKSDSKIIFIRNLLKNPEFVKDLNDGFNIELRKNKYTKKVNAVLTNFKKDKEFNTIVEINKKYNEEGKTISKTVYDMPEVEIKRGVYYIDSVSTGTEVQNEKENAKLSIKNNKYGATVWSINGEETSCVPRIKAETHYAGSNKAIEIEYDIDNENEGIEKEETGADRIKETIETTLNEDGTFTILHSKASSVLKGVYDVTKYSSENYPEDTDIIKEIKEGTIKGGTKLSSAREENGTIIFDENLEYDGYKTQRKYSENGKNTEYSYKISDKNGRTMFNLERSFKTNPDNTTTTVVNGKKYTASFDNRNKIITIFHDNKKTVINVKNKIALNKTNGSKTKEALNEETNAIFNNLKKIPGDKLVLLNKYVKDLINVPDSGSYFNQNSRTMGIGKDPFVISHELGHAYDHQGPWKIDNEILNNITDSKDFKKIYEEELKKFKKTYTDIYRNPIKYFDLEDIQKGSGLAEFFAESAALCTCYGCQDYDVQTRSQFIVRYFPKTFTVVATMLGYNNR